MQNFITETWYLSDGAHKADLSSFTLFCIEFLSLIMSNQVLYHMNEMALNLVLFAKLEIMAIVNTYVKMQQSV